MLLDVEVETHQSFIKQRCIYLRITDGVHSVLIQKKLNVNTGGPEFAFAIRQGKRPLFSP